MPAQQPQADQEQPLEQQGADALAQPLPQPHAQQRRGQGAADLGIVSDAVDIQGLMSRPLCDDPLVLAMPLDHPLGLKPAPSFSDSLAHDYVGLASHSALAVYLEEQALHLGRRMQLRIRAEGFDAVLRMVARGAGLALVPLAALERNRHLPLQSRPLSEAWARRRLLLCARDFDTLPLYAQGLCAALLP